MFYFSLGSVPTAQKIMAAAAMGPRAISLELGGACVLYVLLCLLQDSSVSLHVLDEWCSARILTNYLTFHYSCCVISHHLLFLIAHCFSSGKSPLIVFEDADVAGAVDWIITGTNRFCCIMWSI